MHLIPVFVLIAGLILTWKWEWIGAALYAAAGLLYIAWIVTLSRPVLPLVRLSWIMTIACPAFAIAGLFLANWLKRSELRAPEPYAPEKHISFLLYGRNCVGILYPSAID